MSHTAEEERLLRALLGNLELAELNARRALDLRGRCPLQRTYMADTAALAKAAALLAQEAARWPD